MSKSLSKGKLARLPLVVFLVCSFGQAALCEEFPDEKQVKKLVAAAWKVRPDRIDATLYKTITKPPKSRQQIRAEVEDFFAQDKTQILQEYEPNSHGRTVMLEQLDRTIQTNVERIMKEERTPTRIKKWIRISGDRERHDIAYARTPDVSLGPNTPFERTFVDLRRDPVDDIKGFSYHHEMKEATINNKGWKPSHIEDLAGLPLRISTVLKVIMGTKTGSGLYVPDPNKIQEATRTGILLDRFRLTIVPDPNAPATRDRIELRDFNYHVGTVLICDRNDYARVYSLKSYLPTTGQLLYTRECSNFDAQGFPHNATVIEYEMDGNLKKKEVYTIVKVQLNPSIAEDVFEFRPPLGYTVTDSRTQRDSPSQP